MEGVPYVFIVFGSIVAMIVLPIWFRERTKQSAHRLISQAIDKGQQLDPQLIERLTASAQAQRRPADQARRTLGSGVVLLALAGGFTAASFMSGGFDPSGFADDGLVTVALILGALGLAFTLLGIFDYATKKKTEE